MLNLLIILVINYFFFSNPIQNYTYRCGFQQSFFRKAQSSNYNLEPHQIVGDEYNPDIMKIALGNL